MASPFSQAVVAEVIQAEQVAQAGGQMKMEGSKGQGGMMGQGMGQGMGHRSGHGAPKAEGSKGGGGHSKGKGYSHGKGEGSGSKGYGHGKSRCSKHGKQGHGSYGRSGHGHKKHDPFKHVLKFRHQLGLTPDQINALQGQKFEFKKRMIQLKAEHDIAHMELNQAVHSENINENMVREIGSKIVGIKGQKIMLKIEAKLQVMRTLTPDQRKKVSQMFAMH